MNKTFTIDGLPVVDAKRPLRLHITKADVTMAKPKDPANCAIAVACRRELKVIEARVHLSRIYIRTNNKTWHRHTATDALRNEIIALDRGGRFIPITAHLGVLTGTQRTGERPRRANYLIRLESQKTGKKRKSPKVVKDVRGSPVFSKEPTP